LKLVKKPLELTPAQPASLIVNQPCRWNRLSSYWLHGKRRFLKKSL